MHSIFREYWGLSCKSLGSPAVTLESSSMAREAPSFDLSGGGQLYWINIAFDRLSMFESEESKDSSEKEGDSCDFSGSSEGCEQSFNRCEQPIVGIGSSAVGTEGTSTSSMSSKKTPETNRRSIFQPAAFQQPFKAIPSRSSRICVRRARSTGTLLTDKEKYAIVGQADFSVNRVGKTSNKGLTESGKSLCPCILRESSFVGDSKACRGIKSASDSNLKSSVSFDPYVQVLEYKPVQEEINKEHTGWARMFTYM